MDRGRGRPQDSNGQPMRATLRLPRHVPWWTLPLAFTLGCTHNRADENRGRALFEERCALCHGTGSTSEQGPGLGGVVGRNAAANAEFGGYSSALRTSGLTWDRATLDRFLAAPASVVPGTSMAIAVEDPTARRGLIAYLATLGGTGPGAAAHPETPGRFVPVPVATPGLRTGAAARAAYRDDGPGVRRRITLADLPSPFATPSVRRAPRVIAAPGGGSAPRPCGIQGRAVRQPARGTTSPPRGARRRRVRLGEQSRAHTRAPRSPWRSPGRAGLGLHDRRDSPVRNCVLPPRPRAAVGLRRRDERRRSLPICSGDLVARGAPEAIVPRLTGTSGGHWTRDVAFSADGRRMFVSIGSGPMSQRRCPAAPSSKHACGRLRTASVQAGMTRSIGRMCS